MSAADPQSLRSMAVRGSPGVLVDPYVPSDELEKPSLLSTDYWVNLWRDSREALRSGLARGRMQRAVRAPRRTARAHAVALGSPHR